MEMPDAHFENEKSKKSDKNLENTRLESQHSITDPHLTNGNDYNHMNMDDYKDVDVQKILSHDGDPLIDHKSQALRARISELDEDDDEVDVIKVPNDDTGIDDGFLQPRVGGEDGVDSGGNAGGSGTGGTGGAGNGSRPSHPDFPFAPEFNPTVIMDANGRPQVIPDINVYQQKKNLAQGMMDLALLSANANQLRYVLESYTRHPYYWFSLISITISLVLQVAVGVGLILNSRYNVRNKEEICRADKINNFTIIGIFLITIVNVFISAFGVADAPSR